MKSKKIFPRAMVLKLSGAPFIEQMKLIKPMSPEEIADI